MEIYDNENGLVHTYAAGLCEFYYREKEYEKAMMWCESALRKNNSHKYSLMRHRQLLSILESLISDNLPRHDKQGE